MKTETANLAEWPEPRTLARRADPVTSHLAANRVREFANKHHAQIMAVLRNYPDGLTAHEIAALCKLDAHQVGKRTGELEAEQLIEPVPQLFGGVLTRPSPSGRPARVLRVVPPKAETRVVK